ncbi:MAG: hypothetical protein ACRC8A_19045 [Microcoleaceae cyanobacterium]
MHSNYSGNRRTLNLRYGNPKGFVKGFVQWGEGALFMLEDFVPKSHFDAWVTDLGLLEN